MIRRGVVQVVLALGACRGEPAPTEVAEASPPVAAVKVVPADAAVDAATVVVRPTLSPERAAFWRPFIDGGRPGPEALAWIAKSKPDESKTVAEGLRLVNQGRETWALIARGDLATELAGMFGAWHPTLRDATSALWLDEDRRLVIMATRPDGTPHAMVHWRRYVPIETMLGTRERPLAAFDLDAYLGKPIRFGALPPGWSLYDICDDRMGCMARGPTGPGGDETNVYMDSRHGTPTTVGTITVSLSVVPGDGARVAQLLDKLIGPADASLARSDEHDHAASFYRHGTTRYRVRASGGTVMILITPL